MLINAHSTHQSLTFGQMLANKDDSQDFVFALPFAQSASSDSVFAETLTLGIQPAQPQNTIEIRENLGLLGKIQKAEQAPKILGFPLDEEGYLTATFNNAAGIPESFRIHSETIKGIMNSAQIIPPYVTDVPSIPRKFSTSEDLIRHFQAVYTRLQEIMGDNLQTETGFFTQEQLDSMPHAFTTRDGSFTGKITKIYDKNSENETTQFSRQNRIHDELLPYYGDKSYFGILELEPKLHYIVPQKYDLLPQNNPWSPTNYLDSDKNLSQGGLLAFMAWSSMRWNVFMNQQTDFYTQSYYDIQEGKMTMEEYMRQYAEGAFIEEPFRSGHQFFAKQQISFIFWLEEQGFKEKDLKEMKREDIGNLYYNFIDLASAHHQLEEEEKYAELQFIFFDTEAFLLQLFATDETLDPNLLDVPDSLFEDIERKRALEDERYQPTKKEKETLTQKVRKAGAALAKVEQFLKTA